MLALDDTGLTVPEAVEVLQTQRDQLMRGVRDVQMFPLGTQPLSKPVGFSVMETPRGIFHYNSARITGDQIRERSALFRENEFLLLGPYNKGDVFEKIMKGDTLYTMSEFTRERVQCRCALVAGQDLHELMWYFLDTKDDGSFIKMSQIDKAFKERFEDHGRI